MLSCRYVRFTALYALSATMKFLLDLRRDEIRWWW